MPVATTPVTAAPLPGRELNASEQTFSSWDLTPIFYRSWIPAGRVDKAIVLLHRGHEHSARWEETVRALDVPGAAIFAWDERGHGRSPGERGWAEDFSVYVRDLDAWIRHLSAAHNLPIGAFAVVAHSVAAVIASAWVHDYAPPIRALVLATPAFAVKLYVPLAIPGLRLLQRLRGKSFIKSYVGGKLLTHDPALARGYDSDEGISKNIAVNILLDLFDTSRRLVADAGAIRVPVLMLTAADDLVVHQKPQRDFFHRLSSPVKELELLPGFFHAVFHETERARVVARVSEFLRRQFTTLAAPAPPLLDADESGYTRREYDALQRRLPVTSLRRWNFAFQSVAMETLGRLSHAISVGWKTGFDSGESLDAVYENEARGLTPLGKLIDRGYLDAVGWKGIRLRKVHLQRALGTILHQANAEGLPLRVVDIASGPGRYLLEIVQKLQPLEVDALCRDRSLGGLEAGRALAAHLGLKTVRYEQGDAFDPESLAAISPKPTVAIVSGLYELFPKNAPIRASLGGLHQALADHGWLIYTNQPWHPQVEMIARVLPNRDGHPWIMRRRTQEEMDALVQAAGFEKLGMEIDPWGIFTVSVARKRSAVAK